MKLTADNLAKAIYQLPRNKWFEYINPKTTTRVQIVDVKLPEGPIVIKRYDPKKKGSTPNKATKSSISPAMLWRIASSIREDIPFQIDRVLGASYNTRAPLESLLAYTPEFYWCKPGRLELVASSSKIKPGHKHLVWKPSTPHKQGVVGEYKSDAVVSELPTNDAVYEALELPSIDNTSIKEINVKRRHLQIQIALVSIGQQLGFRTWIADNDKGIMYGDKKVGELDGVVISLEDENMFKAWQKAIDAARYIDCIWFKNGTLMPAVMEVEHTTGITSGLNRMKKLKDQLPTYDNRWVIVAPDEERNKVMTEANLPHFKDMKVKYFPYSAVEELYALCQKRKLNRNAVTEEFLDCYMEPCLKPLHAH